MREVVRDVLTAGAISLLFLAVVMAAVLAALHWGMP